MSSKTHHSTEENSPQNNNQITVNAEAYEVPDRRITELVQIECRITDWVKHKLEKNEIVCTDLSTITDKPEEIELLYHCVASSCPDAVGLRIGSEVLFGDNITVISENLDIKRESLETLTIGDREAQCKLLGLNPEFYDLTYEQLNLAFSLTRAILDQYKGGFATMVDIDSMPLSNEEVQRAMYAVQISAYECIDVELYVGITEIGGLITTDINKVAEDLEVSSSELKEQLDDVETAYNLGDL